MFENKSKVDLKRTQKLVDDLSDLKKMAVNVGITKNAMTKAIYDSGEDVVTVGASHEFGTHDIPKRSFLRNSFTVKKDKMNKQVEKQYNNIFKGYTVKKALSLVGVEGVNIVQEAFTTGGYGTWEPLSQETIDKKGSSQILFNSGTLRNSINFEVVND